MSKASELLQSHQTQFLNLEDFFLCPMYCIWRFVVLMLYAFRSNGNAEESICGIPFE